jgi:hypothetical protein
MRTRPNLRYCPCIFLKDLRKYTIDLSGTVLVSAKLRAAHLLSTGADYCRLINLVWPWLNWEGHKWKGGSLMCWTGRPGNKTAVT